MIKRVNQFSKIGVANFSFWSPRAMHREGALVAAKPHYSSQLAWYGFDSCRFRIWKGRVTLADARD